MSKKKIIQLEKTNAKLAKELLKKERELKIESSLEKVRIMAMAMTDRDDMLKICRAISNQLKMLGVKEIRNVQTAIFYTDRGTYVNYEYYTRHRKSIITETSYKHHEIDKNFAKKMLKGKGEIYFNHLNGKKLKEWLNFQKTTNVFIDKFLATASSLNYYWYSLGPVALGMSTYHPLAKDEENLFRRFTNVFELAYRKYFDIENAEAHVKEAQIQASLEKVRAGSLAMHKSDELIEAGELLFDELRKLGIKSLSSGYVIMDEEEKIGWTYAPNPATGKIYEPLGLVHTETNEMRKVLSSWKKREPLSIVEMNEQETIAHQTFVAENGLLKNGMNSHWITPAQLIALSPKKLSLQNFNFKQGYLMIVGGNRLNERETDLMLRFTKVFQQTYTRFLDLQKAEAQAREAKIEASLERVRSRTTAMKNSNELAEVALSLFQQVKELGIEAWAAGFNIWQPNDAAYIDWITGPTGAFLEPYTVPSDCHPITRAVRDAKQSGNDFFVSYMEGQEAKEVYDLLNRFADKGQFEQFKGLGIAFPEHQYNHFVFGAQVSLMFITYEPCPDAWDIFKRFGKVFEQTYTRFLDLQKAEAQAREAQVEAALERVRSRSIGMRNSEELKEVIKVVYDQFVHLNVNIDHAGFVVDYIPKGDWHFWIADKQDIPAKISTPYFDSVWGLAFNEAKEKGTNFFTTHLNFEEKNKFYRELLSYVPGLPEESINFYMGCAGVGASTALSENVSLYIENFSGKMYTDEENKILMRFGNVFQQTYTRFLDLQKAEAQTREAQIEAALERVRVRTMAMQKSSELPEAAHVIFQQLLVLGENPIQSTIGIMNETERAIEFSATEWAGGGGRIDRTFNAEIDEPSLINKAYKAWKEKKKSFVVDLQGEELDAWLEYRNKITNTNVRNQDTEVRRVVTFAFFSRGALTFSTPVPRPEESVRLLERFAAEFDMTYTRFLDLQKAEASTKEAIKRAALDRIRADIASMRTVDDLDRITPLIWSELTVLGIPFVRCGVFIMDDEQEQIHTFLSTPDGNAIGAFDLSYHTPGNFSDIVRHWHQKKMYVNHWDVKDFSGLADLLIQEGAVHNREQYLSSIPGEGVWLHFLPFNQGMLYVGNIMELSKEDLDIIHSVADAFSTAYARYEDFNRLEAAKKQVDSTLNELQATQKQLVQSEKMASLGELTAGIAHEIQNPLNFVNNFSEVSNELIEELNAERAKPKTERDENVENEILDNIRQNLEKINNHGKRADGIVKGMLQHSRSSSGQKELTDINALADEYLRLAYHGYRAKDTSFNAKFETKFDTAIQKMNIIPQEIGRVLLNIISNAFYAVNEKRKMKANGYEPAINIVTNRSGNQVCIAVSDNGNGIPKNISDKIFQPFFTTKPTGSGTGLGLSLAYDIIKAHGGEITVATKEGEGSEFVIRLPA
jgi:signal transduction histidine kinase